jgi:hypothetical protein
MHVRLYSDDMAVPPSDVRADTVLFVAADTHEKHLRITVHWSVPADDERRTAFYLSIFAIEEHCQQMFSGYHSHSIPTVGCARYTTLNLGVQTVRWHDIPIFTPDRHHLKVDHECTYRIEVRTRTCAHEHTTVQLHSIPYAYDPAAGVIMYTVPSCIDYAGQSVCSCRSE